MITRIVRAAGNVLLSIGALAGVCCLLVTVAGVLFGVRPLIFRSGSMSPTITTGSLAIARPVAADHLEIGDVVSVPVGTIRVAHRITKIDEHSGGATLQLKGDANPVPDARSYQVSRADKIIFSVPAVGSLIAWLSRPPGIFVLAGYAALMLALVLRHRPPTTPGDHDRQRPAKPRRAAPVRRFPAWMGLRTVVVAVLLAALPLFHAPDSWAAWSDSAPVAATLSTASVPAPTLSCGLLGVDTVNLTWTAVSGVTNYTIYAGSAVAGHSTTTSFALTGSLINLSGQASVVANRGFGSTTWSSAPSNTVSYTVALLSLCS